MYHSHSLFEAVILQTRDIYHSQSSDTSDDCSRVGFIRLSFLKVEQKNLSDNIEIKLSKGNEQCLDLYCALSVIE